MVVFFARILDERKHRVAFGARSLAALNIPIISSMSMLWDLSSVQLSNPSQSIACIVSSTAILYVRHAVKNSPTRLLLDVSAVSIINPPHLAYFQRNLYLESED